MNCKKCGAQIDEMEGVCAACFSVITTGGIVKPAPTLERYHKDAQFQYEQKSNRTRRQLYYYSNLTQCGKQQGWAFSLQDFRTKFSAEIRKGDLIVRCAHSGIDAPPGFHKPYGELASDPAERKPTMKDLINYL